MNMSERYSQSERLLERALKVIPLGAQTFSKSHIQYPYGVSPYFIKNGKGSRVWDVDSNEYIDFVSALASITLGYNDPDVTLAVKNQLSDGNIFSLSHSIEIEVAERIIDMVPCAEMVRFGKNGSDATSGAIRLARAYTGRDRVAVCGYHGWQDWFIGSTARSLGVPKATSDLTHVFAYNDSSSLERILLDHLSEFAAVILEPMNVVEPHNNFLEDVAQLARKHGALLIFDETITGFRFADGGAQEYFKVTPDLATFGKGLANGYPVSAIVGGKDIMKFMEDIFFSFTFGGETLSLAAAGATLDKLRRDNVCSSIAAQGIKIIDGVNKLILRHSVTDFISISGHPSWSFLILRDFSGHSQFKIKTLLLQELFARGILSLGSHNLNFAHSDLDIAYLLKVYDEVFPILRTAVVDGHIDELLLSKPLEPLFKVR